MNVTLRLKGESFERGSSIHKPKIDLCDVFMSFLVSSQVESHRINLAHRPSLQTALQCKD